MADKDGTVIMKKEQAQRVFFSAAIIQDLALMKKAVAAGADVNAKDTEGNGVIDYLYRTWKR